MTENLLVSAINIHKMFGFRGFQEVSGISEDFQGFPRSSIGYQGVPGVSKGFLDISEMGFRGF